MRHINASSRRTLPLYDHLQVRFPNTATERLFEFWRDNAPRNLVAPVPLSHWEVEYLADYYKRKYYPCATIEDATMFDVPIINIYYRNILLNMLGIKAMHLTTKILNFANARIGTRKMNWKPWLPWANVRSKCTGCQACHKDQYTQTAANMVYAAKRVWRTVCQRLVRGDPRHS